MLYILSTVSCTMNSRLLFLLPTLFDFVWESDVRARHVEAPCVSLSTFTHINHKMQIFTVLFVCKLPGAGTLNPDPDRH